MVVPGGHLERRDGTLYLGTVDGSYKLGAAPDGVDFDAVVERLADGCRPAAVTDHGERARAFVEQLVESGVAVVVNRRPSAVDTAAVSALSRYHRRPAALYETAVDTTVAVVGDLAVDQVLRSFGVAETTDDPAAADVAVSGVPELGDRFTTDSATPYVPTFDDEKSVCVGPVVSPETVCVDCYRRRRASTRENPARFRQSRGLSESVGPLAGSFAGLAALGVICSQRSGGGPLATRQVTVDPVSLETETHGVFSVPGCESCD